MPRLLAPGRLPVPALAPLAARLGFGSPRSAAVEGVGGAEPSKALVVLCLLFLYVVWGTTYLGLKIALESFSPFTIAALRATVSGLVLLVVLRAQGAPMGSWREWRGAALVGGLLLVAGNGGVSYAQLWISSSLAAIVVASMPLWAAFFAAFAGVRPAPRELLGLGLGFIGVLVLNLGGEVAASDPRALVILAAPVGWALGSVLARRMKQPPGAMAPAAQCLTAAVVLWGLAAGAGESLPAAPSARAVGALIYLTFLGSLVALMAYAYLLRNTRPAVATSYAYVNPLVAVALGVGFAGEALHPASAAAGAFILAGVALVTTKPRRAAA